MTLRQPLRFEPHFLVKVWGGRSLGDFLGSELPEDGPIGEVWQLVDRDAGASIVAAGEFKGRSLRGLMLSERESLLGRAKTSLSDHFPLLIKYLDAGANLSVQVHPDATANACAKGSAHPKTECWYILEAQPDARLYLGLKDDVDAKTFAAQATSSDVVKLLNAYTVKPGDFVHVPAGTVHAIGEGISLVEVQENSDTTYRIFDWGRVGLDGRERETHVTEALNAIDYDQVLEGPFAAASTLDGSRPLVDCPSFRVELLAPSAEIELNTDRRALVYIVVAGDGSLVSDDGSTVDMHRGQTWLLPADAGPHRLRPSGTFELLRVETKE